MTRVSLEAIRLGMVSLLLAVGAQAQVTSATIYGDVLDPTAATIVGAQVTAVNESTGATLSTITTALGEFALTTLQPGRYSVTVEAQGFKQQAQRSLQLAAGQRVRLTFNMELGDLTETVEVSGERTILSTVSAEQRGYIQTTEVEELPRINRDWSNLLLVSSPGVSAGGDSITINGLPPSGFKLTVDGTDSEANPEYPSMRLYGDTNVVPTVSLEAIEEVNVVKGIMSAEIGMTMSGNVNITSKRGTNDFHGSLFWLNQTEDISARNQFLQRENPPLTFNQFGGSLGGPVVSNKAYFFTTYEGYRLSSFRSVNGNVPTPEFRAIAEAAVPAYKEFFDLYDPPNQPYAPGSVTGFFESAGADTGRDNTLLARGDIHLRDDSILSLRYQRGRPFRLRPSVAPRNELDWVGLTEAGSLNFTFVKANWTSETRFGYNFNDITRTHGLYRLDVVPIECCLGFGQDGEIWFNGGSTKTLSQVFGMTKGKHSLRIGGNFQRRLAQRDNVEQPRFRYDNVEDLLADRSSRIQYTYGVAEYLLKQWQVGFFVQDDIKISRNLLVNVGLRWDYQSVPRERDDRIFNRKSLPGLPGLTAEYFPADASYQADYTNFSPRVGFAWTVGESQRTVIRGGMGLFHNPITFRAGPVEYVLNAADEPFRVVFGKQDIADLGIKYPARNADTLPLVKGLGLVAGDVVADKWVNPYSIQWTFGFERELTDTLVFESSYVGNHGVHLTFLRRINLPDRITGIQPFDGFASFRYYDDGNSSYYNAWQSSLRKRFSDDLLFNFHYTWAKSIAYDFIANVTQPTPPQDINDIRADKGPPNFDIAHRLTSDFLYELPFARLTDTSGRGKRLLLEGWQFSGIFTAQTGEPFTVLQGNAIDNQRPDSLGGDPYLSNANETLQYLNPAAFVKVPIIPASGQTARPGTLGRNSVRRPGMWNMDLALSKNLRVTETVNLQIRADMLNAFNHTNMSGVSSNLNNANFGRFTSTRGARIVQFNLRLTF